MELIYARWLGWCTRIALLVLAGSFLFYVFGAQPLVPLEHLPALWRLPVDDFLAASGAPTGWGWVLRLGFGDYANMLGVAMLCLVTAVCYLRVVPVFFRSGERALGVLALLQVAVLLAAASGLFAAGH
jgi:membrane-associated PAP2 superfamily phosphatase